MEGFCGKGDENFGFHKMGGISEVVDQLSASQERQCSREYSRLWITIQQFPSSSNSLSLPHPDYSKPSRIDHKYYIIYKTETFRRIACIQLQVTLQAAVSYSHRRQYNGVFLIIQALELDPILNFM